MTAPQLRIVPDVDDLVVDPAAFTGRIALRWYPRDGDLPKPDGFGIALAEVDHPSADDGKLKIKGSGVGLVPRGGTFKARIVRVDVDGYGSTTLVAAVEALGFTTREGRTDRDGQERFLLDSRIPGVGEGAIARILDDHPQLTGSQLVADPELIAGYVTRQYKAAAVARWRELTPELEDGRNAAVLRQAGFSHDQVRRLRTTYGGDEALWDRVRVDLFDLQYPTVDDDERVRRPQFKQLDALFRLVEGGEPTDPRRLLAGAAHTARKLTETSGSTAHRRHAIVQLTAPELGVVEPAVEAVLPAIGDTGGKHRGLVAVGDLLGHVDHVDDERRIAEAVREMVSSQPERRIPARLIELLTLPTDEQRRALQLIRISRVVVLTGGPGTGKTTTVDQLVQAATEAGLIVNLIAPTGAAVRRMRMVTGHAAHTVHSWLSRCRRSTTPIPVDLLVVDESSFLTSRLAGQILAEAAVSGIGQVVLVGDPDQLPPIGPGRPFHDLIETEAVPVARLTEIHRQAGGSVIPLVAREVREGRVPWLHPEIGMQGPGWSVIGCDTAAGVKMTLQLEGLRLHRLHDGVVGLSPQRAETAGVHALNSAMQAVLNPDGEEFHGWRVGDPVLHIGNDRDFDPVLLLSTPGRVTAVDAAKKTISVRWDDDYEGATKRIGTYEVEVDGSVRQTDDRTKHRLILAYFATYHRSQGSEWSAAVVGLTKSHARWMGREGVYTALTRAREHTTFVVERGALEVALKRRESKRTTALPVLLGGAR